VPEPRRGACPGHRRATCWAWRATARWPGPRGGTSDAVADHTMARASSPPGAPGWGRTGHLSSPFRTGRITLARTCVLIKTASHPARTCVLITCMSQASYGPWPRSDVISRCRQNGRSDRSGTVSHPVTCHNHRDGRAGPRHLGGEMQHRGAGAARHRRVRTWRRGPDSRVRPAARAGAAAANPRLPRSLLTQQSRRRAPADGSARPRLTNARAPC
jgi:hypothetical protein